MTLPVIANLTRRIVTCDREPCAMPAKYQVVLGFWRIGQRKTRKPATKVLTNLCVCEVHRLDLSAPDLLADRDVKSSLLGQLTTRGFPMPDFKSASIEFEPMKNNRRVNPGLGGEWMQRREA